MFLRKEIFFNCIVTLREITLNQLLNVALFNGGLQR